MVMSKSYQGLTATEDLAVLMSKTYYKGEKGDEVADYSYNYKIDAGRADETDECKEHELLLLRRFGSKSGISPS